MTDKQPEALRLAHGLEGDYSISYMPYAAAELRRLHDLNADKTEIISALSVEAERLREVARMALEACQKVIHECDPGPDPTDIQMFADADGALMALREALGEKDE